MKEKPAERKRKRDFFKNFFKLRRTKRDTNQSNLGFCAKIKECGHSCKGVAKEKKCMPCLHPDCVNKNNTAESAANDLN